MVSASSRHKLSTVASKIHRTRAGRRVALFAWTAVQTGHGTALGLAERMSSGLQVCWPFVVSVALRRARKEADAEGQRAAP